MNAVLSIVYLDIDEVDCETAHIKVDLGVKKDIVKTFYLAGACPRPTLLRLPFVLFTLL